jgi:hypothetical protein
MPDNKNNKGSYAAVASNTADNQPEGTHMTDSQPPPCESHLTFPLIAPSLASRQLANPSR